MKIVLDTTNKTIKIEESVNLGELIDALDRLLPGEWKTFKLETNTQIAWQNPIIVKEYPYYPYTWPWYNPLPQVTYSNDGLQGQFQLQSGSYCVEL